MDENNERMNYSMEIEEADAKPEQQASGQYPETLYDAPESDRPAAPDKKTRKKIFLLLAVVALVAALGGSALTAAIRAISRMNEAQQAQTTLADKKAG